MYVCPNNIILGIINNGAPKIRTYIDGYVKFSSFTLIENDGVQKPQCVIYHVVLRNDPLRPDRLERNLTTAHTMPKEKPKEIFFVKKFLWVK